MIKYIKRNWTTICLAIIFIIGFFLRFYKLGKLPDAFFTDEMALGYNGWSILTTGRDEWGQRLPLVLRSFDDYKPAVYSYLTIPGIALFELSQFTARLPAAFFGAMLPLLVYWLVLEETNNKPVSLLSAMVIVLSPWHIEVSRTAIEAGVALSLSVLVFVLVGKKVERKGKWLLISFLGFLILYTYHTARILFPLLLLIKFILSKKQNSTKNSRRILFASFLFGLGLVLSLTGSSSRFNQISIFSDQGIKLNQAEAIREDGGSIEVPLIMTRLFHNRYYYFLQGFVKSYLTNTSLSYLFLGGAQPPRVTIPEIGQFLLCFLPFFLSGLIVSLKRWKKFDQWLLAWILLAPVPASLTLAEIPHSYRTLYLLPVISIYIAFGLATSWNLISKLKKNHLDNKFGRLLLGQIACVAALILLFFSTKAWHQYRVHQQLHQPWHRQYGYEDLIIRLNSLKTVEKITITNRENEPYMAVLFYNQIHPSKYQKLAQKRLSHQAIEQGKKEWQMWQYVFSEDPCPYQTQDKNPKHYYVVMPSCQPPAGYERLKQISFKDGAPELFIDHPQPQKVKSNP